MYIMGCTHWCVCHSITSWGVLTGVYATLYIHDLVYSLVYTPMYTSWGVLTGVYATAQLGVYSLV